MEILPYNMINSSCLELTIAMPGISSSPSSGGSGGMGMNELDINEIPCARTEIECMEEEEDDDQSPNCGPAPARKKLRLTKEQSRLLEESFLQNHTLNPKDKEALALELKLKARQVEVWFQNRRARSKMKQTEMECEYLKKCFGTLREQNKSLRKEVMELRAAMKVAPPPLPHSHQQLPASTLITMCPSCERVTTSTTRLDNKGPRSHHLLGS